MTLPRAESQRETQPRVLVVDDDPAARMSMEGLLADDFTVVTAASVADAQKILSRADFDVILTDYEMPGASGVELLRFVTKHSPTTMVVLVTGHPELAKQAATDLLSVARVITKPYDPSRLVHWVSNAVSLRRMRQATSRLREGASTGQGGDVPGTPRPKTQSGELRVLRVVMLAAQGTQGPAYDAQLGNLARERGFARLDLVWSHDFPTCQRKLLERPPSAIILDSDTLPGAVESWVHQIRGTPKCEEVPIVLLWRPANGVAPRGLPHVACVPLPLSFARLCRALGSMISLPT